MTKESSNAEELSITFWESATPRGGGPVSARGERPSSPTPKSRRSQQPAQSRYILADKIASGGMASVHVALQQGAEGFHRVVAIKRIHPHLANHRQFCEMFVDEARIAARINHPNVCRILDFGRGDDGHFITMEYLAGEPISHVVGALAERADLMRSARFPLVLARIFADLAEGLHAAHMLTTDQGEPLDVVHRDVTPQNLFVLYDGSVRVTDFGIAQARQRVHQTQGELLKGKLAYMAPEQLQRRPVDHRVDIWSLAVVLWECLTLERLFRGRSEAETLMQVMSREVPPPSARNPNVPPALDAVLERALKRDPDDRFQTAREFARDLERCLGLSSDTVPTMDVAEWMRELFPCGVERVANVMKSALLRASEPPPRSAVPTTVIPAAPRTPRIASEPPLLALPVFDAEPGEITFTGDATTELVIPLVERTKPSPELRTRPPRYRAFVGLIGVLAASALLTTWVASRLVPLPAATQLDRPSTAVETAPIVVEATTAEPALLAATNEAPELEPIDLDDIPVVAEKKPRVRPASIVAPARPDVAVRGSVLVSATSGSGAVYENGVFLGRTPARLVLAPGRRSLVIQPDGGGSARSLSVDVIPGALAIVSVALAPVSATAPVR